MKIAKLVIGIFSCVVFFLIIIQSCSVGVGNALDTMTGKKAEFSGSAGLFLAICMLVAGIVGMATRSSKGGGITAGIFYAIGGIIGINNIGSFGDLQIWAILSIIFAAVFILGSIFMNKPVKKTESTIESAPAQDNNEST
jgi:hypothetical protein